MVPSGESIKVLHVDDEPDFTDVAKAFIEREDDRFSVETATSAAAGLERLADTDYDCIVSDYDMPGQSGIEFLESVRADHPDLPFVLYTGKGSEEVASDAFSAGATDYLQKGTGTDDYELLANRIRNAVEQCRSKQQAVETEQRLQTIAEHTNDVLWQFSADWTDLLFVNSAYEEIWGRSMAELSDQPKSFLEGTHPEDRPAVKDGMDRLSAGDSVDIEYRVNGGEDFQRWIWVQGEPVFDDSGEVESVVGFARDITERKRREQALSALHDATQGLMNAPDTETVARRAVETARTVLGQPINGLWFSDADSEVLRPVTMTEAATELFGQQPTYTGGESLTWQAFTDGEITVYDDVRTESDRLNADTQVRSEIIVPLGTYGVMNIGATEPATFSETDISLARILGKTVETALDRAEREQRLEDLQQCTQALLQATTAEETAEIAIETAQETLDAELSGVHLLSEDGQRLTPVTLAETVYDTFDDAPTYVRGAEDDPAATVVWNALDSGERCVIDDIRDHERLAAATPARSVVVHPLADHGVFIVSATTPNAFSDEAKQFSEIVAAGLSSALDRVERERQLRDRETELKRQNDRLEQFTSAVSHDLRNPLTVAQGRLELGREECDTAHLDDVAQAHQRMETLIEDLLTLAREGEQVQETEAVDLVDVVEECWHGVQTGDATLVCNTTQTIQADPSRLQQLLENLIRNAVEHGGEDVTVTVGTIDPLLTTTRADFNGRQGFYLADDGPGIAPDEREAVFEAGHSTTEDGTGFGLNIVQEIAESHGWKISISESESGGARFEITGVETA